MIRLICTVAVVLMTLTFGAAAAWGCEAHALEKDRRAILAMAGRYKVTFQFEETLGIAADYELHEPHHSEVEELIEVIADEPGFISLQHILVLQEEDGSPRVVKHWRQDWTYEDNHLNVYQGDRTWEHVTLSDDEVAGTWSQAVYQVDDSPRYEAIGRWEHLGERSSWESGETWRPLPRREYTQRHDYQVLVARNRHTVTPSGWVHEQDNYKLVLDDAGRPAEVLAHETGLNLYEPNESGDFAAGERYWEDTATYWSEVRAVWSDLLDDPGRLKLEAKVDDKRMHESMFGLADATREGRRPSAEAIRATITAYLVR